MYVGGSVPAPAVARFDDTGAPDESYGAGGIAALPLAGWMTGLCVESGVVVVGHFDPPPSSGIAGRVGAVRLLDDGSGLDPHFGTDGMLLFPAADDGLSGVQAIAQDPHDGSYVAVVESFASAPELKWGMIRFSRDGALDESFGKGGLARFDPPATELDAPHDLGVDSLGRTIVVRSGRTVRFLADGSRDLAFGAAGVLADFHGEAVSLGGIAIVEDDRILGLGANPRGPGYAAFRWSAAGLPDGSFGRHGTVPIPLRKGGWTLVPNSFTPVTPLVFGPSPGEQFLLAGRATLRHRGRPAKTRHGWFAVLVDGSRARTNPVLVTASRPGSEETSNVHAGVWTVGGAVLAGRTEIQTPNASIEKAFLAKVAIDR